jgi:hypothetical protein
VKDLLVEIDAFPRAGGRVEYVLQDIERGRILKRGILEQDEFTDEALQARLPGLGARERALILARLAAVVRDNRPETFSVPGPREDFQDG